MAGEMTVEALWRMGEGVRAWISKAVMNESFAESSRNCLGQGTEKTKLIADEICRNDSKILILPTNFCSNSASARDTRHAMGANTPWTGCHSKQMTAQPSTLQRCSADRIDVLCPHVRHVF